MEIEAQKLADYVNEHPQLLNFLERLEIKLGFGDKTIKQVCDENKIPVLFFVELMLLIIRKYEFNPKYINEFQPRHTIGYLRNSHRSYTEEYLFELESLIGSLKKTEKARVADCNLLAKYFNDYKDEFLKHIQYEDRNVFPCIIELEKVFAAGSSNIEASVKKIKFRIHDYINIHDSLDEKLNDLKNLIIKYFRPFSDTKTVRGLLKLLFELEEDLQLHELIENHILFPQAKIMEDNLIGWKSKK